MDFLFDEHENMSNRLQTPPDWVMHLFREHRSGDGWTVVGKGNKSDTIWGFWRRGLDLVHLDNLQTAPAKVSPTKPDAMAPKPNRYAALDVPMHDDNISGHSSSSESLDDAATDNQKTLPGQDEMWDKAFASGRYGAPPSSHGSDDSSEDEVEDELEIDTTSTSPSPNPSLAPNAHEIQGFLKIFLLAQVPSILRTDRKLDDLLESGDVWSFSLRERQRVADLIERQAKHKHDVESIENFEFQVDKLQDARRELAEIKDNVRTRIEQVHELSH